MTQGLITEQYVKDIADAIRFKNNENRSYYPSEMAEAIMNIPTGGGGLDLSTELVLSSDKTSTTGEVTLTAVLTANYDDLTPSDVDLHGYLEGATINFYDENDTLLYSSITNSEGIAIANIILTGTTSLYCSFLGTSDYQACSSNSVSIEVLSYLFYDECNSDKTNLYSMVHLDSTGNASLIYDATENAYKISPIATSGFCGFVPIRMNNIKDYHLKLDFKMSLPTGNYAYNQFLLGTFDNNNHDFKGVRCRSDNLYQSFTRTGTGQESESTKYNATDRFNSKYYTFELIKQDNQGIFKLYSDDNLLNSFEVSNLPVTDLNFVFAVQMTNSGNRNFGTYLKNIVVEAL